jgi:hypothetical protein
MPDTMLILLLVQFIVSFMSSIVTHFAVKFAIPDESKDSGFCWLNLSYAKLQQDDPL